MDSMNLVSYIDDERLFDYAASCAQTLRPDGVLDGHGEAGTLRRCFQETARCQSLLQRRYDGAARIPAACEWLLDNHYLIRREYPPVRRALRDAERQRACRGKLLTLELCRALLQAGNGRVSEERCLLFLKGFQSVTVDPDGSFPRMDRPTREDYLRRLSDMAEAQDLDEQALARRLVDTAKAEGRHVGFLLYPRRGAARGGVYRGSRGADALRLSCGVHRAEGSARGAAADRAGLVAGQGSGGLSAAALSDAAPPAAPRSHGGVPEEGRSICVLSALLGCVELGRLEELRLASVHEGSELCFGLLADLPAAKTRDRPGDEALIRRRRAGGGLNRKYGGGFYLFLRPRTFDGDGYSGFERKRGALTELAKLLCGQPPRSRSPATLKPCGARATSSPSSRGHPPAH